MGHNSAIICLDVSHYGLIVSSSLETICYHVPSESPNALKWELSYQTKLEGNLIVTCLRISKMDDFCVFAGSKFLSIWT